jgi:hypothetical protein
VKPTAVELFRDASKLWFHVVTCVFVEHIYLSSRSRERSAGQRCALSFETTWLETVRSVGLLTLPLCDISSIKHVWRNPNADLAAGVIKQSVKSRDTDQVPGDQHGVTITAWCIIV